MLGVGGVEAIVTHDALSAEAHLLPDGEGRVVVEVPGNTVLPDDEALDVDDLRLLRAIGWR